MNFLEHLNVVFNLPCLLIFSIDVIKGGFIARSAVIDTVIGDICHVQKFTFLSKRTVTDKICLQLVSFTPRRPPATSTGEGIRSPFEHSLINDPYVFLAFLGAS